MNLTELKKILNEAGIYLTRKRGQNFLIDNNIIDSVVKEAGIRENETILEIGTGLGALTEALLKTKAAVVSYECDKKIFEAASKRFPSFPNLTLLHQDFLKDDFLSKLPENFRVIANVPYNISSQILIRLWYVKERIKDIYLLLQKETALRLISSKSSKDTGFLGLLLQLDFSIKIIKKVPPQSFFPPPKVDSVYIEMKPIPSQLKPEDRTSFFEFIKWGFSQKRKQLLPRLKKKYLDAENAFSSLTLKMNARPEELTPEEWFDLFNILANKKQDR